MAVDDEIAYYLASAGLGLTFSASSAGGIHAGPFPPEASDTATCVIQTPGSPDIRGFGASLSTPFMEVPRFQVLTRDTADRQAIVRKLIISIDKKLDFFVGDMSSILTGATGTVTYYMIQSLGPPCFLKFDESHRVYYYANYEAYKQESPG